MTYSKINFVDRQVERPKTYTMTTNSDNSVTLTDAFGTVTTLGTPLNAENMNHIEDGIANSATLDLDNLSTSGQSVVKELTKVVLNSIYPVGSVYLTVNSTCPLASLFGTWELVSSGRALWTGTGSNGGGTIEAGLPNITGNIWGLTCNEDTSMGFDGAFSNSYQISDRNGFDGDGDANRYYGAFNASKSNSIYGSSSTVQPPAYVVNAFRRTA